MHPDTPTLVSHEWLAPHGGSENVFEQLLATFPAAAGVCLWNDAPDRFGRDISETWLARTPLRRSKAASLPFQTRAWDAVDLGPYERVISSSHAFGHHLAARAAIEGRRAFAYVHTPARYIWNPELDVRGGGRAARVAARTLKRRDAARASGLVTYAANSDFVRDRVRASWGVDAEVIYPPVAVESIQRRGSWADALVDKDADAFDALPAEFILGASRLVEYKRLDMAIRVGGLLGVPVVIAGDGPDGERLRSLASTSPVPVTFVGRVSDDLLYALYQRAQLYVFMAVEDFGIMPIECMALGTPVLVNAVGGAAEGMQIASGGAAVHDLTDEPEIVRLASEALSTDRAEMSVRVRALGESSFRRRIQSWVTEDRREVRGPA